MWKQPLAYTLALAALGLGALTTAQAEVTITPAQEKILQEWTHSLAIQAATWGAPLVTMYALRHHDAMGPHAKAPPNKIWRMEDISTPALAEEAGYVTPNVNVIYGFGFLDLREEPIILEVPDSHNLYYMVEIVDMWSNAFAYVGGKSTGYKGGKFALVGPDWQGTLPTGAQRIDCPTPWILLQPRVHAYREGKMDLAGAKKVLEQIQITSLTTKPVYNYPAPVPTDPSQPVSALSYKDPLQFWELLMVAMNENPPPQDQISALLPMFKPLGIELGKPWDRSKLAPQVVTVMRQAAQEIGHLLAHLPFGTLYEGAFIPPATIGNPGTDYETRAIVARVGLTANTPYEAIYWMYSLDKTGSPLTGSKKYTLTFKQEPLFYQPGFWSITMYDAENNYTVANSLDRYMLGSDTPDLKKNSDGSFTLYLQSESPGADKESNWLPTPPGPFYLTPRVYAPKPETIRILSDVSAWPIPAVIPGE